MDHDSDNPYDLAKPSFRLTQEPLFPTQISLGWKHPVTLTIHANGYLEGDLDTAEKALGELPSGPANDPNMGLLLLLPMLIRAERLHRRAVAKAYPS